MQLYLFIIIYRFLYIEWLSQSLFLFYLESFGISGGEFDIMNYFSVKIGK